MDDYVTVQVPQEEVVAGEDEGMEDIRKMADAVRHGMSIDWHAEVYRNAFMVEAGLNGYAMRSYGTEDVVYKGYGVGFANAFVMMTIPKTDHGFLLSLAYTDCVTDTERMPLKSALSLPGPDDVRGYVINFKPRAIEVERVLPPPRS
jgi:hypothetical protein